MADPDAAAKERHAAEAAVALAAVYEAARADVLDAVSLGRVRDLLPALWTWRLLPVIEATSKAVAAETGRGAFAFLADRGGFDPARMDSYLEVGAVERSRGWVAKVNEALNQVSALADEVEAEIERTMDQFVQAAETDAEDIVDSAGNFGAAEGAEAAGATSKTWHSPHPHPRHNELEGVTVGIGERFPNGLRYPGAPGPPAETANCKCYLTFGRG